MAFNSDLFDLTKWKLTLPVDRFGGGSGQATEVKNLAGYESAEHFYDSGDRAMVFRASANGATTTGSGYARSELREMNGTQPAAWTLATGGTMTATLTVDEVPLREDGTPGRVVIGQIHGEVDELVRLYWDQNGVYFVNEQAGSGNTSVKFGFADAQGKAPNVSLGERFSYKISAQGDTLEVAIYADGQVYTSTTKINSVWQADSFYFKAGIYLGVNEANGSGTGQASFYGLDIGHAAGEGRDGLTSSAPAPYPGPAPALSGIEGTSRSERLSGDAGANKLSGLGGDDTVKGREGDDAISGGSGNDIIEGNDGNDRIQGDLGKDHLKGGAGYDLFVFASAKDTGKDRATQDVIQDFKRNADKIDLSGIDANGSVAGNASFKFIVAEGAKFNGTKGALVWDQIDKSGATNDVTYVRADINGDKYADLVIEMTGLVTLGPSDFIL